MANDPVVLTAQMAQWLAVPRHTPPTEDVDAIQDGVEAIRDSRTVCVPVRTEAEWRDIAEGHFTFMMPNEKRCNVNGWLAALRYAGVLPTGEAT